MRKYIKLLLVFLVMFSLSFATVYAENETNITEENVTVVTNQTVTLDHAHVKVLVNGNYLVIEDDANLLNDNELILLREQMEELTEYGNVVFKTINYNNTDTYSYATNYYYDNFGNGSGTMFIIDMFNRYIYLINEGWNETIITKSKSEIITDNVYNEARYGNYYECAKKVFAQSKTLLSGGKINEPMRYISNIVLSLVTGCFIAYIYVLMKSRIKAPKANDILQNCDIEFNVKSINVQSAGQHKVYSPQSSGSSGGGGHSGGGGGGFSGGGGGFSGSGGGHRF